MGSRGVVLAGGICRAYFGNGDAAMRVRGEVREGGSRQTTSRI